MMSLQVKTNDPAGAIAAIKEAGERLMDTNEPMWTLEELTQKTLLEEYSGSVFISFYRNDALVGGAIASESSPYYWPDSIPTKPAVYISKLSVTNEFAGKGISQIMLKEIGSLYKPRVQYSRLGCDSNRPKLNAVYVKYGFRLIHHCVVNNVYPTNFYEKPI